jgi:hypothetical protein
MITPAHGGQGDLYLGNMLLMVVADDQVQALQQRTQPLGGQGAKVALVDRERREQLADDDGIWRRWGRVAIELGKRRLALGEVAAQLTDALHDRLSRLRDGLLVLKNKDLPAKPCLQVGNLALQLGL